MKNKIDSVLVVCKKSVFEMYSNSSDVKTKEYALSNSIDGKKLRGSHKRHTNTLDVVISELEKTSINYLVKSREEIKEISNTDLVITIGGDGTVLDMARYINDDTTILGVNSDPELSVGNFCYCTAENFSQVFKNLSYEPITKLNRLGIELNETLLDDFALNEVLIAHTSPAAYMRYRVKIDGKKLVDEKERENLRSSGLLLSVAGGSTAFIYQEGGFVKSLDSKLIQVHERSVRNAPFLFAKYSIEVESLSREGKIFVDGEHRVYDFSLGDKLKVILKNSLNLIGNFDEKRKKYLVEPNPRKLV